MIIDGMPLGEDLAEIEVWGHPWHGLCQAGVLTLPNADTQARTQPDSGDVFLARIPGTPAVVRDTAAQARDAANGTQWLDYTMLSGWYNRQFYGKPLAGGHLAWLYSVEPGRAWRVDGSGISLGSYTVGGVTTARLSGSIVLHSNLVEGGEAAQTITLAGLDLPAFPTGEIAAWYDIVSIRPDGGRVLIGFWPDTTTSTAPSQYSDETIVYSPPICRGFARGTYHVEPAGAEWAGDRVAYLAPYLLVALDISRDVDGVITGVLSVAKDINALYAYVADVYSDTHGAALPQCSGSSFVIYESTDFRFTWHIDSIVGVEWQGATENEIKLVQLHDQHTTSTSTFNGTCSSGLTSYVTNATDIVTDSMCIVTAGTIRSRIDIIRTTESYSDQDMYGNIVTSSSVTTSEILIDGVALITGSPDQFYFSFFPTLRALTTGVLRGNLAGTSTESNNIGIHAVRYSNNAYAFVLVPYLGSLLTGPYRMGIVNVVDGSRTAAPGYFTPPAGIDPIDYVYDGLDHVTVEPVSAQLERGASVCFV